MKIRCKNCGKRFDAEMYSGLCPKCGTYNDMRWTKGSGRFRSVRLRNVRFQSGQFQSGRPRRRPRAQRAGEGSR